jgi:hypothetical protein
MIEFHELTSGDINILYGDQTIGYFNFDQSHKRFYLTNLTSLWSGEDYTEQHLEIILNKLKELNEGFISNKLP